MFRVFDVERSSETFVKELYKDTTLTIKIVRTLTGFNQKTSPTSRDRDQLVFYML